MRKSRKLAERNSDVSLKQGNLPAIHSAATVTYPKPKKTSPPPITRLQSKKLIAFGWYGGKFSHLEWLLPLLPPCHHYCEPFAGSAAVLLNRTPSPVETYNDLDGERAIFCRVLRDEKDRLIEAIGLTPFSREEKFAPSPSRSLYVSTG